MHGLWSWTISLSGWEKGKSNMILCFFREISIIDDDGDYKVSESVFLTLWRRWRRHHQLLLLLQLPHGMQPQDCSFYIGLPTLYSLIDLLALLPYFQYRTVRLSIKTVRHGPMWLILFFFKSSVWLILLVAIFLK